MNAFYGADNREDRSTEAEPNGLWNKQRTADYLGIAVNTLNHWICDRQDSIYKNGLVKFRKRILRLMLSPVRNECRGRVKWRRFHA